LFIAGGAWLYLRGRNPASQNASPDEAVCGTTSWRTKITFDNSRPELVSTSLQSDRTRDEVGCVDIVFACRSNGPYFEVRLDASRPQIDGAVPIFVSAADEWNASLLGSISDDGRSTRISNKNTIEVLAAVLIDRYSFDIRLGLANGRNAVAQFHSLDLSTAIRPVLLACQMRSFQSSRQTEDAADHD
jgi:hypothetical protein